MVETASFDQKLYREVLGHLPTGVTVVAALHETGAVGMTANAVTSVSLNPPLLLFCAAKTSTTWPLIRESGRFCVNVLAGHHEALCRSFALLGVDRFGDIPWHLRPCGPALEDAVAWIDCEIFKEHDGGDHTIVVSRVVSLEALDETSPLVFFRGRYGTFRGR